MSFDKNIRYKPIQSQSLALGTIAEIVGHKVRLSQTDRSDHSTFPL